MFREADFPYMSLSDLRSTLPFQYKGMILLPIEESELDFVPLSVLDDEQNGKQNGKQLHGILVANALSISFEDAERIKNQIGLQNVTGDERLEKAEEEIRETTAQLIVGVRNTLNFYDVDHEGGTINGVVLTGTGARLIGLPPVLASSINKVVRIGDPFVRFRLSREVESQNIVAHAIDLAAVLGLVIGKKPR
ncbi:pilus assembly protein PilM [Bifidobacterium catenulatum]|uniref:Pilus assembly protein PilM n=1 Tax=Bifidobacterium catenulatum TaxID=1686 RepID=A0A1V8PS36_9BIFI|nr:pilus assembly protein PilM [Bifidobacterium catenulatum]OQM51333.1 pilus assembly protein PilM [Bifidobacterium catenulatum]